MVGGGRLKADHVGYLVKFVLRFGAVSDSGVGASHVFVATPRNWTVCSGQALECRIVGNFAPVG